MSLETVRISRQGRDQLITLKRRTGIEQWNVLCRWAFCLSIADASPPRDFNQLMEGGPEMTWKIFGGEYENIYLALLKHRCRKDGYPLDEKTLSHQFRLHLHRGISHLMGTQDMKTIDSLLSMAIIDKKDHK